MIKHHLMGGLVFILLFTHLPVTCNDRNICCFIHKSSLLSSWESCVIKLYYMRFFCLYQRNKMSIRAAYMPPAKNCGRGICSGHKIHALQRPATNCQFQYYSCPSLFFSSSTSTRLSSLPTADLGNSRRNSTFLGTLYAAILSLQKSIISFSSAASPSFRTI